MSKPVIFISAASLDLKKWRQALDGAFSRAGFRVIAQGRSMRSTRGKLRRLLVDEIAEADCVIHLAGMAYGWDAENPFPEAPKFRCSWTQFEYYHAHATGKDVIALVCGPELSTPFSERGKLKEQENNRILQQEHRGRVEQGTFQGTPLEGRPQTLSEVVHSEHQLLEAVVSAIKTLERDDPAYDQVQVELHSLIERLDRIEVRQRKHQRFSIGAWALSLAALAGMGFGVAKVFDLLKSTGAEISGKMDRRFATERRYMAQILAREREKLVDWQEMSPGMRFSLALEEIALEQNIPVKQLQEQLELYVAMVEQEPNPDAEDKYNVQMHRKAYVEAAHTARGEADLFRERMSASLARAEAAATVAQAEREKANEERERAIDFYVKEGAAHHNAGNYRSGLDACRHALSLIDKSGEPLEWAEAGMLVALELHHLSGLKEAEPLLEEILKMREKYLPENDPKIADTLNYLAMLLRERHRLGEAEKMMERVFAIQVAAYGQEHPEIATTLCNWAMVLRDGGHLKRALPLMERALQMDEALRGKEHVEVAVDLNDLSVLLLGLGRRDDAEVANRRALHILEKVKGKDHPDISPSLHNLGRILQDTQPKQAEAMFRRVLRIDEQAYGENHPSVATCLCSLGAVLEAQGRPNEAEQLYRRALGIDETSYGLLHPAVATDLNNLAVLLMRTERYKEAELLAERALRIDEAVYPEHHPSIARDLNNLAHLLTQTERKTQAEPLLRRALAIREAVHDPGDSEIALELRNLGLLLLDTGRAAEAEPLMKRALEITEAAYPKGHPAIADALTNLVLLLDQTGRSAEGLPLLERALELKESIFPPGDPEIASALSNLAAFQCNMGRAKEAEPLSRRAVLILLEFERTNGAAHPIFNHTFQTYRQILRRVDWDELKQQGSLDSLGPQAGWDKDAWIRRLSVWAPTK